jgi:hypothetical protein
LILKTIKQSDGIITRGILQFSDRHHQNSGDAFGLLNFGNFVGEEAVSQWFVYPIRTSIGLSE